MKKTEIKVGGLYTARISGRYVTVRVDEIRQSGPYFSGTGREVTVYDVTNLLTRRTTTFRSAARFRSEVPALDITKANKLDTLAKQYGYSGEEANPMRPTEQETSEEMDPSNTAPAPSAVAYTATAVVLTTVPISLVAD